MSNIVINQEKIKDYTDFTFHFFEGCKIGEGLFFNSIQFNAEKKYNRMQLNEFYFIFNTLLGNGYIEISAEGKQFVKLTQKGSDFLYGDEILLLYISLNDSLSLNKRKPDETYNELWNYIGKENDALFYVKGPLFFNVIKTFLPTLSPTYGLYTSVLKEQGKPTSRVSWYRDLFLQLREEDIKLFLDELSKAINSEIEKELSGLEPLVDILDINITPVFSEEQKTDIPSLHMAGITGKAPHVFISYAWEKTQDDWVLNLSNELRKKGINCQIDKYQEHGTDLVRFMRDEIRNSDRVLVILTPKYKEKAESGRGGASYEGSIMSHAIYNEQNTTKFIPLLREGSFDISCPDFISGRKGFDFSDDSRCEDEFAMLVKVLKGEPIIEIASIGG